MNNKIKKIVKKSNKINYNKNLLKYKKNQKIYMKLKISKSKKWNQILDQIKSIYQLII